MSIRWDKRNKRWRFEFDAYVQGNRQRASRLLPRGWSKAEADDYDRTEGKRLYKIAAGLIEDDPMIESAVAMYLTDKTHLKSFKTAAEHLAAIHPAYAGKRMSALKDVADFVAKNRAREDGKGALSDATVKQRLVLLKAACRWAWKRHGLTKHDPTGQMHMPTVDNARHVYKGRREMLQACRACTNWTAQIAIRVGFYTGMRLGELWHVQVDGTLLVLPRDVTKNGQPRIIPAHPKIRHLLRHLPLSGPKITVQRAWSRARDKVGLGGMRFHDWRHSAASEMINSGVALHTVGKVLGHLDARSTDRYAHLDKETLSAAIGNIGKKRA